MSEPGNTNQPAAATGKRVAVIDLGSNTARLIALSTIPGYSFRLEDEIREVVRLRQGMTEDGLSDAAIARGLSTLRLFKRFCDSTETDVVLATATSAVRDAANGAEFVERVRAEAGLELRVLDGEREAYYGVIGALNDTGLANGAVLDIGGGSAQLSEIADGRFGRGVSRTLGALALAERFPLSETPKRAELRALEAEIEHQLDSIDWLEQVRGTALVGIGGTIRNLAKIEAERQANPLHTLHGFTLTRASVEESIDEFRRLTLKERRNIPGLSADRADIILQGTLVLRTVMDGLEFDSVAVSTGGLREGIFFEHFWRHLPYPVVPDVRRFSVLNIARNYRYQKQHANHVRYLAGRLFEQLVPLHGYGPAERELLDAAALLHDLGTVIAYDGHHKHSQTLILYNGLAGFSQREIALVALLTRYHRKGTPDASGYEAVLEADDTILLRRLAAVLRLAEYLERGRNAAINDVIASWTDDSLRLTLIADEHPAVELWDTERNALPAVEAAFGRHLALDSITAPEE